MKKIVVLVALIAMCQVAYSQEKPTVCRLDTTVNKQYVTTALQLLRLVNSSKQAEVCIELSFDKADFSFSLLNDRRKYMVICKPNSYTTVVKYESKDKAGKSYSSGEQSMKFNKKISDNDISQMKICIYFEKQQSAFKLAKVIVNNTNIRADDYYEQLIFDKLKSDMIRIRVLDF